MRNQDCDELKSSCIDNCAYSLYKSGRMSFTDATSRACAGKNSHRNGR